MEKILFRTEVGFNRERGIKMENSLKGLLLAAGTIITYIKTYRHR